MVITAVVAAEVGELQDGGGCKGDTVRRCRQAGTKHGLKVKALRCLDRRW